MLNLRGRKKTQPTTGQTSTERIATLFTNKALCATLVSVLGSRPQNRSKSYQKALLILNPHTEAKRLFLGSPGGNDRSAASPYSSAAEITIGPSRGYRLKKQLALRRRGSAFLSSKTTAEPQDLSQVSVEGRTISHPVAADKFWARPVVQRAVSLREDRAETKRHCPNRERGGENSRGTLCVRSGPATSPRTASVSLHRAVRNCSDYPQYGNEPLPLVRRKPQWRLLVKDCLVPTEAHTRLNITGNSITPLDPVPTEPSQPEVVSRVSQTSVPSARLRGVKRHQGHKKSDSLVAAPRKRDFVRPALGLRANRAAPARHEPRSADKSKRFARFCAHNGIARHVCIKVSPSRREPPDREEGSSRIRSSCRARPMASSCSRGRYMKCSSYYNLSQLL